MDIIKSVSFDAYGSVKEPYTSFSFDPEDKNIIIVFEQADVVVSKEKTQRETKQKPVLHPKR